MIREPYILESNQTSPAARNSRNTNKKKQIRRIGIAMAQGTEYAKNSATCCIMRLPCVRIWVKRWLKSATILDAPDIATTARRQSFRAVLCCEAKSSEVFTLRTSSPQTQSQSANVFQNTSTGTLHELSKTHWLGAFA